MTKKTRIRAIEPNNKMSKTLVMERLLSKGNLETTSIICSGFESADIKVKIMLIPTTSKAAAMPIKKNKIIRRCLSATGRMLSSFLSRLSIVVIGNSLSL